MSWDLDDILRAAGAGFGDPCLVEVARALRGPASTIGYLWSTGRIRATVGADFVRIERRLGEMGDGPVTLGLCELAALDAACSDWAKRRDGWAAFYYSGGGHPPGFGGGSEFYQPPGEGSQRVRLATQSMGRRTGEGLLGSEEAVPIPSPVHLSPDVRIEDELWRPGERHGPREGSLVGMVYRLSGTKLAFEARRDGGDLQVGGTPAASAPGGPRRRDGSAVGTCVHLEPGEEAFVTALRKLLSEGAAR